MLVKISLAAKPTVSPETLRSDNNGAVSNPMVPKTERRIYDHDTHELIFAVKSYVSGSFMKTSSMCLKKFSTNFGLKEKNLDRLDAEPVASSFVVVDVPNEPIMSSACKLSRSSVLRAN